MKGCTCDLTGNGCDPNCCCDTDCNETDQLSFTECKDTDVKYGVIPCLLLFILVTVMFQCTMFCETCLVGFLATTVKIETGAFLCKLWLQQ